MTGLNAVHLANPTSPSSTVETYTSQVPDFVDCFTRFGIIHALRCNSDTKAAVDHIIDTNLVPLNLKIDIIFWEASLTVIKQTCRVSSCIAVADDGVQ